MCVRLCGCVRVSSCACVGNAMKCAKRHIRKKKKIRKKKYPNGKVLRRYRSLGAWDVVYWVTCARRAPSFACSRHDAGAHSVTCRPPCVAAVPLPTLALRSKLRPRKPKTTTVTTTTTTTRATTTGPRNVSTFQSLFQLLYFNS